MSVGERQAGSRRKERACDETIKDEIEEEVVERDGGWFDG